MYFWEEENQSCTVERPNDPNLKNLGKLVQTWQKSQKEYEEAWERLNPGEDFWRQAVPNNLIPPNVAVKSPEERAEIAENIRCETLRIDRNTEIHNTCRKAFISTHGKVGCNQIHNIVNRTINPLSAMARMDKQSSTDLHKLLQHLHLTGPKDINEIKDSIQAQIQVSKKDLKYLATGRIDVNQTSRDTDIGSIHKYNATIDMFDDCEKLMYMDSYDVQFNKIMRSLSKLS